MSELRLFLGVIGGVWWFFFSFDRSSLILSLVCHVEWRRSLIFMLFQSVIGFCLLADDVSLWVWCIM